MPTSSYEITIPTIASSSKSKLNLDELTCNNTSTTLVQKQKIKRLKNLKHCNIDEYLDRRWRVTPTLW